MLDYRINVGLPLLSIIIASCEKKIFQNLCQVHNFLLDLALPLDIGKSFIM